MIPLDERIKVKGMERLQLLTILEIWTNFLRVRRESRSRSRSYCV